MRVHAGGFALCAPGLESWADAVEVLVGLRAYVPTPYAAPPPPLLSATERRRASPAVRLAIAAADGAVAASGLDQAGLATVFASSNGDGQVVASILEALVAPHPAVSPTQFHNSVHNAAAAYWAIGARCQRPSTSLGCHDDTFAAGLMRAAAEACTTGEPVLLSVYDAPMPAPLAALRPTRLPFAVAMVLTAEALPFTRIALDVSLVAGPPSLPVEPELSALRELYHANPAARCLRLMEAIAHGAAGIVELPYLGDSHLVVRLAC